MPSFVMTCIYSTRSLVLWSTDYMSSIELNDVWHLSDKEETIERTLSDSSLYTMHISQQTEITSAVTQKQNLIRLIFEITNFNL